MAEDDIDLSCQAALYLESGHMAKREAGKQETARKNPFLPTLSIHKWKPDRELLEQIDHQLSRATAGHPDNQWYRNFGNGDRRLDDQRQ